MYQHFPDVASNMTGKWGLVESFRHGPRGRVIDIKCYPWTINNFCLIGDAAHAIFPFFGQGLNFCLEDLTQFERIYDEVTKTEKKNDW